MGRNHQKSKRTWKNKKIGKNKKIDYSLKDMEKIYKALGNFRRLKIILFLKQNQKASVTEIARHLGLSLKSTSKHLLILKTLNILDRGQNGLIAIYRLNSDQDLILKNLLSQI